MKLSVNTSKFLLKALLLSTIGISIPSALAVYGVPYFEPFVYPGVYGGMRDASPTEPHVQYPVNLTVSEKGTLTGSVLWNGKKHSFSGKVGSDGKTYTIPLKKTTGVLTISPGYTYGGDNGGNMGFTEAIRKRHARTIVSLSDNSTTVFSTMLNRFCAKETIKKPVAGYALITCQGVETNNGTITPTESYGTSLLRINNSEKGTASVVGLLADGTKFTAGLTNFGNPDELDEIGQNIYHYTRLFVCTYPTAYQGGGFSTTIFHTGTRFNGSEPPLNIAGYGFLWANNDPKATSTYGEGFERTGHIANNFLSTIITGGTATSGLSPQLFGYVLGLYGSGKQLGTEFPGTPADTFLGDPSGFITTGPLPIDVKKSYESMVGNKKVTTTKVETVLPTFADLSNIDITIPVKTKFITGNFSTPTDTTKKIRAVVDTNYLAPPTLPNPTSPTLSGNGTWIYPASPTDNTCELSIKIDPETNIMTGSFCAWYDYASLTDSNGQRKKVEHLKKTCQFIAYPRLDFFEKQKCGFYNGFISIPSTGTYTDKNGKTVTYPCKIAVDFRINSLR